MIKPIIYNSLELSKQGKKDETEFRALHTNFQVDKIGKLTGKVEVIFVNEDDDPDNSPEILESRIIYQRLKDLTVKLKDGSITDDEVKEYLKLKL